MTDHHLDYMTLAHTLAAKGRFSVSPNPMVGCVLVNNGVIVGRGYHERAGEAHAEIQALLDAGDKAKGASAYVTLEPCCHMGRTPPCTDALIKAGIKKVFIATLDPNPLVAGKGQLLLENAGIKTEVGLGEKAVREQNEIFFHYITQQRPFVIAKWAMSLDGKTITHPDDARDISNAESKIITHELRQQCDAILIGAKTALHDDPLLTVRLPNGGNKHPIRIVLDSKGTLPVTLKLFATDLPAKTIVATTDLADKNWCEQLRNQHVTVLILKQTKDQQVDLHDLLTTLGQQQISSLLVEGGMTVHENFMAENLIDRLHVYVAPVLIGKSAKKQRLSNILLQELNSDYHFTAMRMEKNNV